MELTSAERRLRAIVQHYNHQKYWKYREILLDPVRGSRIGDLFRLFYIKRADAFNNASFGTHRNYGAVFAEPPSLPHGIYGIIVSHNAIIGKNARIFHQVTIGDDAVLGAGCKIIGGVKIGNRVKIGAGCVVMTDIPDDSIVLPPPPQIISRRQSE